MALPTAVLDDRTFQNLVDEAKKKIPLYCPEWTDHNVSDPGVALIELFAWMIDLLLYRLNQVPEKHYIKLLELLGIKLQAPMAAVAPLTFYLSAPQLHTVVIPRGTSVATLRADQSELVAFTTNEELSILPARLDHILLRRLAGDGTVHYEPVALSRLQPEFTPFTAQKPVFDEALVLGMDEAYDNHVLAVDLTCVRAAGMSIIPENPPLRWQAWTGQSWSDVVLEEDGTGGRSGQVRMRVPVLAKREINGIEAYWLRCQVVQPSGEQRAYSTSPIIRNVSIVSWGGTVTATHSIEVTNEPLGRSDGSPGQIYRLTHTPVLPRREDETVEIWGQGMEDWQAWQEVEDFGDSGADDRHYTLDSASGEICFGPAIRQSDGTVRRYGAIPARGADIRMSRYRVGGGVAGNVRAGALHEMRSPIAYVDRVTNTKEALGGLDPESLEMAKFRAGSLLRSRGRAVTAEDFEHLTLQAFPEVGRAMCLQSRPAAGAVRGSTPGQVYVLVIPQLGGVEAQGYIPLASLTLSEELRQKVLSYLDERRLLTTQLEVRSATYKRVRAEAEVVARPGTDIERLRQDIVAALNRFINPLVGGPDGRGWPFGRELYLSDLYTCIQQVNGLQYIQTVTMSWIDEADTAHPAERKLDLLAHEVLVSDLHSVTISLE